MVVVYYKFKKNTEMEHILKFVYEEIILELQCTKPIYIYSIFSRDNSKKRCLMSQLKNIKFYSKETSTRCVPHFIL